MITDSDYNSMFNYIDEDCYTSKLGLRNIKFSWTIKNFEYACKTMKFLESPRFPKSKSDTMKWCIRFEPTELNESNADKFNIILRKIDDNGKFVNLITSILNSSGKGVSHRIKEVNNVKTPITWSYTGSYLYKQLLCDNSPTKNVTVICELCFFDDSVIEEIEKPLTNFLQSENLLEQIETFFDDEDSKDVTFQVEEKEFTAHKMILTFRSPVFAAMFRNKMKEELTSIVEIEDIKPEIFQKMLRFIYTDKVEDIKEFAFGLFYAAEKYQLMKLKNMCINSLYNNLSLETVCKTVELAELFSISELKEESVKYLVLNSGAVEETEEFEKTMKSCPHLAKDILNVLKTIKCEMEVDVGSSAFTLVNIHNK